MPKAPFLPTDDGGKDGWLKNYANKLPTYSATVGVTAPEVASVLADSIFFTYALNAQGQFAAFAQQWTAYKNNARNGDGGTLGPFPVAPVLPAAPALVAPGIFRRVANLAARIKRHPGYSPAIGQDLQIIGADQTVDVNTVKPLIEVELQAGRPVVLWPKQGMDGLEIWVDRGAGFAFLAIDTQPDYPDTAPLPAAGQSAIWKYKAIYRQGDEQVGQWSDVVSITVAG